jgi:hypothetical protein
VPPPELLSLLSLLSLLLLLLSAVRCPLSAVRCVRLLYIIYRYCYRHCYTQQSGARYEILKCSFICSLRFALCSESICRVLHPSGSEAAKVTHAPTVKSIASCSEIGCRDGTKQKLLPIALVQLA